MPEFSLLLAFWSVCRLLPVERASAFGRRLFQMAGPRLAKHRHVRRNLAQALGPRAREAEIAEAALGVWGNLGTVMAEYPHLGKIVRERLEVDMCDAVRALKDAGKPAMFLSGHIANWEVAAAAIAQHFGPVSVVYSEQDNPCVDRMLQRLRGALGVGFVEKDTALRALMSAFASGKSLGLLPDQRVDSGAAVALCGLPAPTTVSPARLALRFACPIIPLWVERTGIARYKVVFEPPLAEVQAGVSRREAAVALMAGFNERLSARITARPGEWLCTKRRWKKLARPAPPAVAAAQVTQRSAA